MHSHAWVLKWVLIQTQVQVLMKQGLSGTSPQPEFCEILRYTDSWPNCPRNTFAADADLFNQERGCPGCKAINHFDFQKVIWRKNYKNLGSGVDNAQVFLWQTLQ